MSTIIGSIVNISGGDKGGGEPYNHLMCNEQDIHMSSINYEEKKYIHDLESAIISH